MRHNIHIAAFLALLLAVSQITEGKRTLGRSSGSRKSSSSSGGRRTSYTSSSGSATKPTFQNTNSHADLAKLSYSGYNSQPNRPPSSGGSAAHKPSAPEIPKTVGSQNSAPAAPIGWNVPKENPAVAVNKPPSYSQANMGPPPAYSPHNTPGGAKTNINEPPPVYKPANQGAPPPYPVNNQPSSGLSGVNYPRQPGSNYPGNAAAGAGAAGIAAHGTGFRHHGNSTGFGGSGIHTPIQSHSASPVMGSYPAGGSHGAIPQGATYYPQGQLPPGAVLYPHGSYPQGGPPMGGYPGGGFGGYPQQQPVFVGSGIQPGVYSAGSMPVQHQSSSGPGFGTGLLAGAVGGAVLGHVLTPTHHVTHTDSVASGAAGSDRVIIINNTPGQAAEVTNPAPGVQVINPGQPAPAAQPAPAVPAAAPQPAPASGDAPASPPVQPAAPGASDTMVPLAPFPAPATPENPQQQPANPPAEGAPAATGGDMVPLAPFPQTPVNGTPPAEEPKVYCYPVQVNVTDPADPTKMTTVEQIACYTMAPQPPQPAQPEQPQPAAPAAPVQQQPDIMRLPGDTVVPTQKTSTAELSASSNLQASGTSIMKPATFGVILAGLATLLRFIQ